MATYGSHIDLTRGKDFVVFTKSGISYLVLFTNLLGDVKLYGVTEEYSYGTFKYLYATNPVEYSLYEWKTTTNTWVYQNIYTDYIKYGYSEINDESSKLIYRSDFKEGLAMFGDVDLETLRPIKPNAYLCKPNKRTVGKLKEAYDVVYLNRLGDLNELTMTIPYYVDIRMEQVRNPNIDMIRERYLIKLELGSDEEYFIITEINDDSSVDGDTKTIKCISLGYELRDKMIRSYEGIGVTAKKAMTDALASTVWSIGKNLTDEFHHFNKSASIGGSGGRTFDITSRTVLDFVIEIAESFNAVLIWDTKNRVVDFELPDNIGGYKGFTVSYGKFLQSLSRESNTDEMVTVLTPIGSEGLTIHSANPVGSGHIEDFGYFMYPFEMDASRNVIKHSHYMSDSLCMAILDYKKKIEARKEEFTLLLQEKSSKQQTLTEEQNKLFQLETQNIMADDIITAKKSVEEYVYEDVEHDNGQTHQTFVFSHNQDAHYAILAKDIGVDTPTSISVYGKTAYVPPKNEWVVLDRSTDGFAETDITLTGTATGQYKYQIIIVSITVDEYTNATNTDIIDKYNTFVLDEGVIAQQAVVDEKQADVNLTNDKIVALQSDLDLTANFTPEQITERNQFIIEKEISNDSLISSEELYQFAEREFERLREPQMVIDIDIVNFLEVLDHWRDWDKLRLGDTIKIKHETMDVYVDAKIIEIEYDYENQSIKLKIANVKDIKNSEDKLIDALYGAISTSTTVEMAKFKWNKAEQQGQRLDELLDSEWDAVQRKIVAGTNESVEIGRKGILIKNPDDPDKMLVANHAVLAITRSGGRKWEHAITTEGIIGERIIGKILIGENLLMMNESGSFIFDRTGITVKDSQFRLVSSLEDGTTSTKPITDHFADTYAYTNKVKSDLQGEISDVNDALSTLDTTVNTTFRDGVLEDSEKATIRNQLEILRSEKADVDSRYDVIYANPYLIDDSTVTPVIADKQNLLTAKTNFDTAFDSLVSTIESAIQDSVALESEKVNIESKFILYRDSLSSLSLAFESAITNITNNKANEAEDNARAYADGLKLLVDSDISDVDKKADSLQIYVDGTFKDGVIEESEALAIGSYINSLSTEKADIDQRYSDIYNNHYLKTSSVKNQLNTSKTAYDTSHTALINSINTAISDSKTTTTEKADVDSKFSDYSNKLGALSVAFEKAIDDISKNKTNESIGYDKAFEHGKDFWTNTVSGKDVDALTVGSILSGSGSVGGKVLELTGEEWIYSRYAIPVDVNRTYKMKFRVKQTADPTSGGTKVYAGVATLDKNYTNLSGGVGTHRYFGASSETITVANGWMEFEGTITGVGDAYNQFRLGTAYVRPMFIVNYSGGNGTAQVDLISFDDVTEAIAGQNAWSQFSGDGNTLPAGNVLFSNGLSATDIETSTLNFQGRNDRNSAIPRNPVVSATITGTVVDAIDHTTNTDGSVDISFEWDYDQTGDAGDIDGFVVYVMQGSSSGQYSFGSSKNSEQVYYVTSEKRSLLLYGVPANRYYTFGVQAYRIVDQDVSPNGVLQSAIIKSVATGENPYRPSSSVAFSGSITGTIRDGAGNEKSASVVADNALGSLQKGVTYNNLVWDTNTGFMATRSDNKVRTILNATTGISIQKYESNSWVNKLYADSNGNLTLTGNINMTGGSISWANVTKPTYTASEVDAKPSSYSAFDEIGSNRLTKIDQNGIYTGTLVASQIVVGSDSSFSSGYDPTKIEVGGKNIIPFTNFLHSSNRSKWSIWNSYQQPNSLASVTLDSGEVIQFLDVRSNLGASSGTTMGITSYNHSSYKFSLIAGQEYTISFLAAVHSNAHDDMRYTYILNDSNSNQNIGGSSFTKKLYGHMSSPYSLDIYEYTCTFKPYYTEPKARILIGTKVAYDLASHNCGLFYVARPKLERGNRATEWDEDLVNNQWRAVGKTTIDGGHIETDSIKAVQIDVGSLWASSAFIDKLETHEFKAVNINTVKTNGGSISLFGDTFSSYQDPFKGSGYEVTISRGSILLKEDTTVDTSRESVLEPGVIWFFDGISSTGSSHYASIASSGSSISLDAESLIFNGKTIKYSRSDVLWSGGAYMHGTQEIALPVAISECPNGIIFLWADYDESTSTVNNFDNIYTVLHKSHIADRNGQGVHHTVANGHDSVITKYTYVSDTLIKGNDANSNTSSKKDVVLQKIIMW